MKNITLLFFLVLFTVSSTLAYDYCFTTGWSTSGCESCNNEYSCGTYCYINLGSLISAKNIYNVYYSGSTSCSATSGWVVNLGVSQYNQIKNSLENVMSNQRTQPINLAFNNGHKVLLKNNKTITLYGSCTKVSGSSGSLTYGGMTINQICFDHYNVQINVFDGPNPIQNANVSYYFWNGTNYVYVDSVLTDQSGVAVIDACYNCNFKLNVNASGYKQLEKTITVSSNVYTINMQYEGTDFSSLFNDVIWKIEPEYQYLERNNNVNQTINLTVWSFNNTLEYFSLNITSINNGEQLFFQTITSTSGGIINGTFNNSYSNVTLVKIKIKAVGFDEFQLSRVYYSYEINKTYEDLSLHGLLNMLANQTVSIDGMTTDNSTKLFFSIIISIASLAIVLFVGQGGGLSVFGGSIIVLIMLAIFASYDMITWSTVAIIGFLVIGLSLLLSGVI